MRIRRSRLRWLAVVAPLVVVGPLVATSSALASGPAPSGPRILETDIVGNGNATTTGEPEIAQNPTDPSHLFIDWTTVNSAPGDTTLINNPCGGQSTANRGLSWQPATLPLSPPAIKSCADAIAAYGPDGTLYAGGIITTSFIPLGPPPCTTPGSSNFGTVCILISAYDGILRSTDNGATWSPASTKIMGSASEATFPFAPGSGQPLQTFDRPWLSVDQSSNTLYAAGHNLGDHEGFVTTSTNDGQSFGTIYAVDSSTYPQGGMFGGTIAAADGVLAVAYPAASAPGATCPCVIFETSTDHGATFVRHVVPTVNAAVIPDPFVAANPNHPGQFALTVFDSTGTENQVYTTNDFGQHWQGPAAVAETPPNQQFKPWLSYGPDGQLALVWRTWQGTPGTAPYDVWAAIGRQNDHGVNFSAPLRVTNVPAAPYPAHYTFGDDFSWVTAGPRYIYVAWGDGRDLPVGGGTQVWLARIPYQAFQNSHA